MTTGTTTDTTTGTTTGTTMGTTRTRMTTSTTTETTNGITRRRSDYSRRMTVAGWILRLYWNLLYLIDLPVDFLNKPLFPSDLSLAVNCYVPLQYISIFAVLGVFHAQRDDDLKADISHLLLLNNGGGGANGIVDNNGVRYDRVPTVHA